MGVSSIDPKMSSRLVYRPVWLSVLILGLLLLTASVLLVGTAYRSRDRLQPIHVHLDHLSRLQQAGMGVQEVLTHSLGSTIPVDPQRLTMLRDDIDALVGLDGYMVADTPQRLTAARDLLSGAGSEPLPRSWTSCAKSCRQKPGPTTNCSRPSTATPAPSSISRPQS
jgi:hypothetical protein